MSHEIETIAYAHKIGSNVESYQVPWHGLGTPVMNDLSPREMLVQAKLDWSVDRYSQFVEIDGEKVSTGKDVLVRSSDKKILTHISEDWEPVQNEEAFDFFTDFVHSGDMEMNTAGSLKGGNMVWALAKIKDDGFTLFNNDKVEGYLLFSNPHEYGKSIDIRFTAIRVVCNNTLTLALNAKSDLMVRLNHRRKFDPEMVKNTLGLAKNNMNAYKEMAEFIANKKFSVEKMIQYYQEVFPLMSNNDNHDLTKLSRPGKIAYEALETQPGAEYGNGSWWQVYNSATFAIDHLLGRSVDTRLTSAWYGGNRQRKVEALKKAVEFAEAA